MCYTLVYKINGIYDILCSISILVTSLKVPILSDLHLSMFKKEQYEVTNRFFAYWIFTYGCMRMSNDEKTIFISYIIESMFMFHELKKKNMIRRKVLFCIMGCLILVILPINYKYINYIKVP